MLCCWCSPAHTLRLTAAVFCLYVRWDRKTHCWGKRERVCGSSRKPTGTKLPHKHINRRSMARESALKECVLFWMAIQLGLPWSCRTAAVYCKFIYYVFSSTTWHVQWIYAHVKLIKKEESDCDAPIFNIHHPPKLVQTLSRASCHNHCNYRFSTIPYYIKSYALGCIERRF